MSVTPLLAIAFFASLPVLAHWALGKAIKASLTEENRELLIRITKSEA